MRISRAKRAEVPRLLGERWPRLLGEPWRAYQAFLDYAAMGPGRSLQKLIELYQSRPESSPPPTRFLSILKVWSSEWDWQVRVDAWDAENQRRQLEDAAAEMERVFPTRAEVSQNNTRHFQENASRDGTAMKTTLFKYAKDHSITLTQLSRALEMSLEHLSRLKNGHREVTAEFRDRCVARLGADAFYLFTDGEEEEPKLTLDLKISVPDEEESS